MKTIITRTYNITREIPVHLTNLGDTMFDGVIECQYWFVAFPCDVKHKEVHVAIVKD